jgi:uncharacterized membrane-anchored protein
MNRTRTTLLFVLICALQLGVCAYLIIRWESVLRHGQSFNFLTRPVDPYDAFRGHYVALQFEQDVISIQKPDPLPTLEPGQAIYLSVATDTNGFACFSAVHSERPNASTASIKATVQYIDSSPSLTVAEIIAPDTLAERIRNADDIVSVSIRERLLDNERNALEKGTNSWPMSVAGTLVQVFNRLQYDPLFIKRISGAPTNACDTVNVYEHPRLVQDMLFKTYADLLAPLPLSRIHVNLPFDRYYMDETEAPRAERAYWDGSRTSAQGRTHVVVRIHRGLAVIEQLMIGDQTITDFLRAPPAQP